MGLMMLTVASLLVVVAASAGADLLRPEGPLDAAITVGVLGSAEIALIVGMSGALGLLEPATVLAAAAAWAGAALLAVAMVRRRDLGAPRGLGFSHEWVRSVVNQARRQPWVIALIVLGALALAWQAVVAVLLPPFSFDGLTYHLTIVAGWVQHGSLHQTDLSLCCSTYPLNAELMFAWPALLQGTDTVVDLVQLGFAVLGAMAVAGLARSAGLGREAATGAAALFVVTPIVLVQTSSNFVDVMVTSWTLAALHGLVRFAVTHDVRRLVPPGLATGLVLGTKGTGILWGVVLAGAAVVLLARSTRRHRLPLGRAVVGGAVFLAACLALGTYWYARNWVDTGNPVHPFRVAPLGVTVFEGPTDIDDVLTAPPGGGGAAASVIRSWAGDVAFWDHGSYNYQQRRGGLGPLWPWLALPLLVPYSIGLARRRNPAMIAVVVTAIVFALQPYRWWSRFTMQLVAMGVLAVAAAAASPVRWVRVAVRGAALALATVGVLLSSFEVNPAGRAPPLRATSLLRLVGEPSSERELGRLFFPEYRFLEDVPDDATVVVDLPAEPVRFVYPLFGPSFDRTVVPANGGSLPVGAWVVTAGGRPLDLQLRADGDHTLVSDVRAVRVWRPS